MAINPFRQQCNVIDDMELPDSPIDIAQRVSGVFAEVYQLGINKSLHYIMLSVRNNGRGPFDLFALTEKLKAMSSSKVRLQDRLLACLARLNLLFI